MTLQAGSGIRRAGAPVPTRGPGRGGRANRWLLHGLVGLMAEADLRGMCACSTDLFTWTWAQYSTICSATMALAGDAGTLAYTMYTHTHTSQRRSLHNGRHALCLTKGPPMGMNRPKT